MDPAYVYDSPTDEEDYSYEVDTEDLLSDELVDDTYDGGPGDIDEYDDE